MAGLRPYGILDRDMVLANRASDDHPSLATNLLRELQTERAAQSAGLADSADWADFQRRRGILEGLDIAIARCENAQKLLQG